MVPEPMSKSIDKLKFEEAMRRLQEIVNAIESGETDLEDTILQTEEAMKLAARCKQILHTAEQRVRQIQLDASGKLETTPFEPEKPGSPEADGH